MKPRWLWLLLLMGILLGCQPAPEPDSPAPVANSQPLPSLTPVELPTLAVAATLPATPLPSPELPTPIPTVTPLPQPTRIPSPTPVPIIHLAAVGDIMLDRTLGNVIANGRPAYPFAAVADLLQPADLTIGNVESALGDQGEPNLNKSYAFRAPPGAAEALGLGGFDIVTLANNHALDYGPEALLQGIELLEAQGIVPLGAGADRAGAYAPYITTINGVRLGFLAYVNVSVEPNGFDVQTWEAGENSPGLAWGYPEEVAAQVAALASEVDHVIVLLHSGLEYVRFTGEVQREIARGAIDAGATLVLGHHAHILQGIESYSGGVIAYGLGNFAFDIDGDPATAVLHVWLDKEGVIDLELIPAMIQVGGAPRPATPEEAAAILAEITEFGNVWD